MCSTDQAQKHWLSVYHAEWRKLQNQARFIKEIIDGDLIVGKKKKDVLVRELRQRKYEAFPRGKDLKKKATDGEDDASGGEDNGDEDDDMADSGARDYDYLLSVSEAATPALMAVQLTIPDADLVSDSRAAGQAQRRHRQEEGRA